MLNKKNLIQEKKVEDPCPPKNTCCTDFKKRLGKMIYVGCSTKKSDWKEKK
jgi:hypothetical protein